MCGVCRDTVALTGVLKLACPCMVKERMSPTTVSLTTALLLVRKGQPDWEATAKMLRDCG